MTQGSKGNVASTVSQEYGYYYVNKGLDMGVPVTVGLDYKTGDGGGNGDGITDHHMVVVDTGWDSELNQSFITVKDNLGGTLYNLKWNGETWTDGYYTVTTVRASPTLLTPGADQHYNTEMQSSATK